ncbi:MAG: 2-C-methyl-D-erythritol 2,4-cyclodiphosphate synthase [Lentisphaeria bacterium]|nr:2-C-methyl-D-erythritol 2,4-cyclodiphosphate synthase [Lentisphaeria bacterium]
MEFRVGQGYDVHRLVENRKLILCGVDIPYERGLDGHSDADVAVHALIDALLGAAALGDIGQWFPDSDPAYAGADSMHLLENVMRSPRFSCYGIVNADVTLIAQAPKLGPWREKMRSNLADGLCVALDQVSVKFTTTEKLGFTGRGEGIAAEAVVLIKKLF